MRLIDKEELLKKQAITYDYNGYKVGIIKVTDVAEAPEVPAVTPVRCKDCKYRQDDDFCGGRGWPAQLVPDDGYCDRGARMDGDSE